MALSASGKQEAIVDQVVDSDLHGLILDPGLVKACAAAPNQAPRLSFAGDQTASLEQVDDAHALHELGARDSDRG